MSEYEHSHHDCRESWYVMLNPVVADFTVNRPNWPGDVQPYVALGKLLLKDGHRVRIATHETFRTFVNDSGLEFYSIGGNPQDLMSYMVKSELYLPQYIYGFC